MWRKVSTRLYKVGERINCLLLHKDDGGDGGCEKASDDGTTRDEGDNQSGEDALLLFIIREGQQLLRCDHRVSADGVGRRGALLLRDHDWRDVRAHGARNACRVREEVSARGV